VERIGRRLAGAALLLAGGCSTSEQAAWITGQTYPVNGGFSFAL